MASLNQQSDVGVHEGDRHSDSRTVRQDKVGALSELLDEGENVVPTAAVQTGAVLTELVDDLDR